MAYKNKEDRLIATREWREKNKDKVRKYNREIRPKKRRERRRKLKLKGVELLGGKCKNCGYKKNYAALDFHHKQEKKEDLSKLVYQERSKELLIELKKCDLLCSNCHREEHNKDSFF